MSRIGIALAGGGPLGGIYEVGACTAQEEAIDGLNLTHAGCFVGVSSGSFIAAALANGISPEKLSHILLHDAATVFDPRFLLRPAFREYFNRLLSLPHLAGSSALTWLRDPLHHGLFESYSATLACHSNRAVRQPGNRPVIAPPVHRAWPDQ